MSECGSIPAWLLTGYLGAGKTTLLNRLLEIPSFKHKRLALLINEFGDIGVDGALVRTGEWSKFELNKGSLFCACIKADTVKTLRQIAFEVKPDAVIIEATGLSESSDLEALFESAALEGRLRTQANVCLVDASTFTRIAAFLPAATRQVQQADGILINKCDLVDQAELARLEAIISRINPAPIYQTSHCDVPSAWFEGLWHSCRCCGMSQSPPAGAVSVSIERVAPVDRAKFTSGVRTLGDKLLRLKGNIDFGDGSVMVELAGGRLTERPAASLSRAPTAFVAIGWDVDRQTLMSLLS
ncbi:MAG: GTP-binding protein [Planctomycetes bacterium]|nr:GTP-binding protein [Planctomycetota bacterium]